MHTKIHDDTKIKGRVPAHVLTRAALADYINGFLIEMAKIGYRPTRVVLFGSYVNGKPHKYSDIDLAIWAKGFVGNTFIDLEKVVKAKRDYHKIQLHCFAPSDTVDDDPFIEVIEKTGTEWEIPNLGH